MLCYFWLAPGSAEYELNSRDLKCAGGQLKIERERER